MSYKKYNTYQNYNTQAVALGYTQSVDIAPKVLATGKGLVAELIIKKAIEHNIPIKQDKDLIKLLSVLEINSIIPIEAFSAVAEVLNSIYKFNEQIKDKKDK